jgi:glutathione S-transferase
MGGLVLTTYDWVPPPPRGFVRDIRVRWALEEAKPWLTDGDISIFESGAILLHLGERSEALIPRDPKGRS